MSGLLLPLDIEGLSTTQIRIQLFDQNCKSQLNLIFISFELHPHLFMLIYRM